MVNSYERTNKLLWWSMDSPKIISKQNQKFPLLLPLILGSKTTRMRLPNFSINSSVFCIFIQGILINYITTVRALQRYLYPWSLFNSYHEGPSILGHHEIMPPNHLGHPYPRSIILTFWNPQHPTFMNMPPHWNRDEDHKWPPMQNGR